MNRNVIYTYGNLIQIPHLPTMEWDYQDNFKFADLGGGGEVFYVYDSSGERVRKIVEKQGGIIEERKYLGGYEVFTKKVNGTLDTERTSLFVSDGNKTIAQIDDNRHTKTVRYQYDNHLGSLPGQLMKTEIKFKCNRITGGRLLVVRFTTIKEKP